MKAIVCVSKEWGIGNEGKLLFNIPEDMKYFKQITEGHTVVMGRRTLESFPGSSPLKNRINIVLTHDSGYDGNGAVVINNIASLFKYLDDTMDDVYVIGGECVYKELLAFIDTVYVTKVSESKVCDSYFPDLDISSDWKMISESEDHNYNGLSYKFTIYKRIEENVQG